MIKLLDFSDQKESLEKSSNPISKVLLAHLIALETYGNPILRFENKLKLVKDLYKLPSSPDFLVAEFINTLYDFIEYTNPLPPALEAKFTEALEDFENEGANMMPYVSLTEKKGIKQGKCNILLQLLKMKFGPLPQAYLDQVQSANVREIERMAARLLNATHIEEVFVLSHESDIKEVFVLSHEVSP